MIKEYYRTISSQVSAVTFQPATEQQVHQLNQVLKINLFSQLPEEYIDFLNLSDGLIYNGIEFYGLNSHHRLENKYFLPDLESCNTQYIKYSFFTNKVILGRLSEGIICYNFQSKIFSVSDRINLRPRMEFTTFEELFKTLFNL